MKPYTDLILKITDPPRQEPLVKTYKCRYFAPNKYDVVQLKDFLNDEIIYSLADYLENLYEYPLKEVYTEDFSEEELEEYKRANYVELLDRLMPKRIFDYFQFIKRKEFVVIGFYEGLDEDNIPFTRVEFKYEHLKLKNQNK